MNPFLRMLMGQQGGTSTGGTFGGGPNADGTLSLTGGVPEDEIVVEATRNNERQGSSVDGMSEPNDQAISNVQADIARGREASERKGMFGVKGTLRDVLGLVGDAFLVQGGRNPYYQPLRRQENISDAMAGFTENPQAAAERVAYYDPKMGQEILSDAETSLLKKAQLESLNASREDLAASRKAGRYDKARPALTALFNTPQAYLPDGSVNPAAIRMAETIAKRYGFTLQDFVEDTMTAEEAQLFAGSGIPVVQQERLEDADANIGIANRNADSRAISANASMIRAQRPPTGRAPRGETPDEKEIRIGDKPPNERTPGEAAWLERRQRPPSSGKKTRTVPGSKPKPSVSNWYTQNRK